MSESIDFYFDFSSPYAYLGSHLIEPVAQKHGREVNWHPFMLGVAMKGDISPDAISAERGLFADGFRPYGALPQHPFHYAG